MAPATVHEQVENLLHGQLSTAAGRAFAGREADIGNLAGFFERHVEALLSFEPVDRHVVRLADGRQIGSNFGLLRRADLAPRTVAEIDHAVLVPETASQRVSAL